MCLVIHGPYLSLSCHETEENVQQHTQLESKTYAMIEITLQIYFIETLSSTARLRTARARYSETTYCE